MDDRKYVTIFTLMDSGKFKGVTIDPLNLEVLSLDDNPSGVANKTSERSDMEFNMFGQILNDDHGVLGKGWEKSPPFMSWEAHGVARKALEGPFMKTTFSKEFPNALKIVLIIHSSKD